MVSPRPTISMIAALGARTRALGKDNRLLWHIPEDMKRFRKRTTGHTIVMGRTTYESIGKPLPERVNIVVTHEKNFHAEVVLVCTSVQEALRQANKSEREEIFIIGGGQIYREFLPIADKLYLTLVDDDAEGDTFFPEYEGEFPRELKREDAASHGLHYTFVTLARS